MRYLTQAFSDISFMVDISISLAGLTFMCLLIYAMRWIPGRVENDSSVSDANVVCDDVPLFRAKLAKLDNTFEREAADREKQVEEMYE